MVTQSRSLVRVLLFSFLGVILFSSLIRVNYSTSVTPQVEWLKQYGVIGGMCDVMIQTSDGGYILAGSNVTGSTMSLGYTTEPMITKTNSSGDIQWEKTYNRGSLGGVNFQSIIETNDSGYVIIGGSGLLKIDSEGSIQWKKSLAIGVTHGIQSSDMGYLVVANSRSNNGGPYVATIIKADNAGNILWNKTFSDSNATGVTAGVHAHSVIETKDESYAITGTWGNDCWLLEISSDGEILLNERYNFNGGPVQYQGFSIVQTRDNGYAIAGYASPTPWIAKIDLQGTLNWTTFYSDAGYFRELIETGDGGFITVGGFEGKAWVAKTDSSGTMLWNSTYGDRSSSMKLNVFNSVSIVDDGGCTVAGTVNDTMCLVKFAPESVIPEFSNTSVVGIILIGSAWAVLGVIFFRRNGKDTRNLR